jgi:hypothetical protein
MHEQAISINSKRTSKRIYKFGGFDENVKENLPRRRSSHISAFSNLEVFYIFSNFLKIG